VRGVGVAAGVCVLVGSGEGVAVVVGVGITAAGAQEASRTARRQIVRSSRTGSGFRGDMGLIVSEKEPCEGFEPSQGDGSLVILAFNEVFGLLTTDIVAELFGRSFKEV